jgi:beta-glucosidase
MINLKMTAKLSFLAFSVGLVALAIQACSPKITQNVVTEKHKDTTLTFEERATYLVSLLTLQQKVDQMNYESPAIDSLGIPAYNWWNECLHGVARSGKATVFPQAIGMAAMFDRNQMGKNAVAISDEARAKHHEYASRGKRGIYQGLTYWTPNINIFRDPRWGRGMETYGEDPYLTGEMAVPFIKGLQGNDPKYLKLVATAKHFIVHSGPEIERHKFNATPSPQDFINTYSPHFKKVVTTSGVYSVMCAYNAFEGKPCCGNPTLSSLLRNDWGFKGYIVSDCWAIRDFFDKDCHGFTSNVQEAAAKAVQAGTDLNCGNSYPALVKAVEAGLIKEEELDVSLIRLFVARLKLGLFAPEGAVSFEKISYTVVDSELHRLLALETARKSIVLLKNENNFLPLEKSKVKKVAVIGPNADDLEVLLGNYNGYPTAPVSPLQGLKDKLPNSEVKYAVGCKLADGLPVFEAIPSKVLFTTTEGKENGLKAEYFDNIKFEGTPKHTKVDKTIDFTWRATSPFEDISYDKFSVRWSGFIKVEKSGRYALGGEAFSSMKLFLDDSLLMERNDVHHPKKIYEYLDLEAGRAYKIRFESTQDNTEHAIMRLLWEAPNPNLEQEALELAAQSDVIIMCMGISPLLEGEEMKVKVDGFSGGDRDHIKLPATQTALMKKLKALGKPMVLVLLNGSALSINWEDENIPAIVEAWYPGQAGGTAIADVIFGDYNPAGRLPVTFYKDIKDIPAFNNYSMSGKTYRYFKGSPLYAFGHGLSYSTFSYGNLIIEGNKVGAPVKVSVKISNTSGKDGDEVPQVYVRNKQAEANNPQINLVGFERINLKAGESKTINFEITPEQLALVTGAGKQTIVAGEYQIWVGGSQPSDKQATPTSIVTQNISLVGDSFEIK